MIVKPKVKTPKRPKQSLSSMANYPKPPTRAPPPVFGPESVTPLEGVQIDQFIAKLKGTNSTSTETRLLGKKTKLQAEAKSFSAVSLPQENDDPIVSGDFDITHPIRLTYRTLQLDPYTSLSDLLLVAKAASRNHDIKGEALAYMKVGTLMENENNLKKANEYYDRILKIPNAEIDPIIYNRIGVNLQLLHRLDDAVDFHLRHLSFGLTPFQALVANSNLALVFKQKGDNQRSVEYYKIAIDLAHSIEQLEPAIESALKAQIELADCESKANEIGMLTSQSYGERLEKTAINKRQVDAMEDYFITQARIAEEQEDLETAFNGLCSAGKLNCVFGDFERAGTFYTKAVEIAKRMQSNERIDDARVALGIVKANNMLKAYGLFDESGVADPSIYQKF